MKKILLTISLLACTLLLLIAPHQVGAQVESYGQLFKVNCENIPDCIEKLLRYVMTLAFPIAIIFIMFAGFMFVIAQGDQKKLSDAKAMLTWAIIGLVIVVGAWTLAVAFKNFFTGPLP